MIGDWVLWKNKKVQIAYHNNLANEAAEKGLNNTMEANDLLVRQYKNFLAFIDSLPEDDLPKTKGWLARNKDESLVFCYHKPHRENSITQEWWGSCDADFRIYDDAINEQFKDLKWEDEPVRVEIAVKRLDSLPEDHFRDSTKMISEDLEEAARRYSDGPECSWVGKSALEYAFIAGAEWQKSQMPMPEDTVIFMKGVEEGRRLEREDRNDDKLPRYYGD